MAELYMLPGVVGTITQKNLEEVKKLPEFWIDTFIECSKDQFQVILAQEVKKLRKYIRVNVGAVIEGSLGDEWLDQIGDGEVA